MPCAHPIPAVRPRLGGSLVLSGVREIRDFGSRADGVLQSGLLLLPCGSCVGCLLSRARSWAIRCSLELVDHSVASFVTLTYRESDVPVTLVRSHLSEFVRSVRKRWMPRKVRFFGCGEYGEWRGRPHYHALLYGCADEEVVERSWPYGFATVSDVTPGRIAYTAGYCAKKVGMMFGGDRDGEVVDESTGECVRYQPPFLQMSLRPGIGGAARRYWRSWRAAAVYSGREVPVPRFLHESWKEHASVSELADLEREKLERSMALTIRELDASEVMASARVQRTLERRSL